MNCINKICAATIILTLFGCGDIPNCPVSFDNKIDKVYQPGIDSSTSSSTSSSGDPSDGSELGIKYASDGSGPCHCDPKTDHSGQCKDHLPTITHNTYDSDKDKNDNFTDFRDSDSQSQEPCGNVYWCCTWVDIWNHNIGGNRPTGSWNMVNIPAPLCDVSRVIAYENWNKVVESTLGISFKKIPGTNLPVKYDLQVSKGETFRLLYNNCHANSIDSIYECGFYPEGQ